MGVVSCFQLFNRSLTATETKNVLSPSLARRVAVLARVRPAVARTPPVRCQTIALFAIAGTIMPAIPGLAVIKVSIPDYLLYFFPRMNKITEY